MPLTEAEIAQIKAAVGTPPTTSGMDIAKAAGIFATAIIAAIGTYRIPTDKPLPPPVPAVVPADPVQTKLVGDVADLQARVKVLETPVKK